MSDRERASIAGCLANILQAAEERHADPASVLKLNHAEVLAAHHDIVALINILRSQRPLNPCALARARLLTDNDSPLLVTRPETNVREAVRAAFAAVPKQQTRQDEPGAVVSATIPTAAAGKAGRRGWSSRGRGATSTSVCSPSHAA